MQYGHNNESVACEAYIAKQCDEYDKTVFVSKTGLYIDCLVKKFIIHVMFASFLLHNRITG